MFKSIKHCDVLNCFIGLNMIEEFCNRGNRLRHRLIKIEIIRLKGSKCEICGYSKCISALDFHHRDPKFKKGRVSDFYKFGLNASIEEAEKCALLCSNCHREQHSSMTVDEAIKWKDSRDQWLLDKTVDKHGNCKFCNKDFIKIRKSQDYCSRRCADRNRDRTTKINWPDNLLELVNLSSKRAVAKKLGVSDVAVAKRLKKYGGYPAS